MVQFRTEGALIHDTEKNSKQSGIVLKILKDEGGGAMSCYLLSF